MIRNRREFGLTGASFGTKSTERVSGSSDCESSSSSLQERCSDESESFSSDSVCLGGL